MDRKDLPMNASSAKVVFARSPQIRAISTSGLGIAFCFPLSFITSLRAEASGGMIDPLETLVLLDGTDCDGPACVDSTVVMSAKARSIISESAN
jgi:hypothetical protein